jgi:adenine-specific DNA methylase
MTDDRRLIEDSLPLEAISEQSAREKSIRHGHISTLHIWWARRPLAAMRAAIFASLIPAPKDEKEREYLHKLIADIVNWDSVKDGNNARVEEAHDLIRKYYPDAPPKVLDPFMGGGSTGLEALRLGCEAHGVELNPVAYLIELCTLVYPQKYGQPKTVYPQPEAELEQGEFPGMEAPKSPKQMALDIPSGELAVIHNPLAEDVRKWGRWVLEEARKEIGHLYEDPEGRTIVGYLWARTAKCPNPACGADMPMVRQLWVAKTGRKNIAIRMLVDKAAKTVSFEIDDNVAKDAEWPNEGTMKRGTIVCPVCGTTPSDDHLKIEGRAGRLGAVLMSVVYDTGNGKGYRAPTDADGKRFSEASTTLDAKLKENPDILPYELLPPYGTLGFRVNNYGLEKWGDLFNARQALMLITFAQKLQTVYELAVHELDSTEYATAIVSELACVVDRMADKASTLALWNNIGEKIEHTFGRQALPMVWDYAEVNPFSGSTGDWESALEWVVRAIEHCSNASPTPASLRQGDASRLTLSNNLLDAVVTDPPYYDAVPYADLSDFFYVWLKRCIGDLHPDIFSTPLTPKKPEIIQEPARHNNGAEAKQFYETQMTRAFSESARVLKPEGIFIVVFAHKSTAAWETLINSLLSAGLVVSASWPLHTERPGRLRAQNSAALASSIFIVCRKRVVHDEGFYDDVRRELQERIAERLSFFWSQGIRGADFFISAIGPAVEVFGRYSAVRKLSGDLVSVADLLDLVQEAVADYALGQIMNGRYKMGTVDAPTRFYVMYRWSYGGEKLIFDDARRLAQALGAEVNDLIHRYRLLSQSGDSVTLPDAARRKNVEHLGESGRDGIAAPVIDVLHRAVLVWQNGDRRALAEFLATHALGREDEVNSVAQALVNVLPQGDKERQLLENYLQGSGDLPDVPRQQKLI